MCRWMAYTGSPLLIEDLLYAPENSLVVQSLHARLGVEPTNGDGFGVGWYGERASCPGCTAASSRPGTTGTCGSWPAHIRSRLVLAHVRASTGTPVQQTNCHPFRHGRWLWVHNGAIAGFREREAGPRAGGGPRAVPRHRGVHRLRAVLLPGPHVRAARTTRPRRSPAPSA